MIPATGNGGLPLPAPGGRRRLVEATHPGCAARTRMSLPAVLPVRAVRRFVCEHCEHLADASEVSEVRAFPRPDLRWLTLPVAALAVFAVLSLLNGDAKPPPEPAPSGVAARPAEAPAAARGDARADGSSKPAVPADAQLVAESTFSLALPAGWDRVKPAAGATFAAVSADGTADATLWVRDDPKLDLAAFEASSLAQLETLAGSARVVDRKVGPSIESSSVTLAPRSVPEGSPTYEVVLRGSGRNWYYLATTHGPSAPSEAVAGVDVIQGSFVPLGGKG